MSLSKGKAVEDVKVVIPFPKAVSTVNLTCNVGNYIFDDISKVRWAYITKWQYRLCVGCFTPSFASIPTDHATTLTGFLGQVLEWNIGKIPKDKTPLIQGNVAFPPDHEDTDENPVVTAEFKIQVRHSAASMCSIVSHFLSCAGCVSVRPCG